jgi:hypothetical protein
MATGPRSINLSTQTAFEFSDNHVKIQTALNAFAAALTAKVASVLPDKQVVIQATGAATISFTQATMDKVYIKLPLPQNCLHSHTISPVINKFDYKITEWDAADRLEYQGKAALVAGASIIFVAYAKLDLLETPEFTRFLERFKSHQHLNLFRYAENLSKIVLARGQNDTAALLAVNQEIAADEVRTQALWAKRQSIVDRISATNGSNAAWIARVQGDITRLQSILVPAKYESFTFAPEGCKVVGVTQHVEITYNNRVYPMGHYKVSIDFANARITIQQLETALIMVHNSTRYPHPHIMDTSICWGNMGVNMANMMRDFEMFGAFFTVSNYLNSYNDRSPYNPITDWPSITTHQARARNIADEAYERVPDGQEARPAATATPAPADGRLAEVA